MAELVGPRIADAKMFRRALNEYKKAWGSNPTLTLDIVNNLVNLYVGNREQYVRTVTPMVSNLRIHPALVRR